MPLRAHLVEFRKRLLVSAAAIVIGTIVGWILSDVILDAIRAPITELASTRDRQASLNFSDVSSAFDLRFQIAITAGIVLSSPVWLYEVWAFLMPALKVAEKRYAAGFLLSAVPLFLAGCAAGWFVLPHMVVLLAGFAPDGSTTILTARPYFDFVLKLVLAIGVAFVLPVFLVLLNLAGVMSGKAIIKAWRIALLAIVAFTAIATPAADVMAMFLLALPMIALYFAAASIALLTDRRRRRRADRLDESFSPDPIPTPEQS
ncbi:sec-independent protein translocase protein TatC [Compostimonas suwonensis]|uniref:Sec-independent protein translocase protein TatC n=2 Tax=Compostimonas suwonensis TaxID=1048394 RepID=A0A2M9C4I3_9MICO|nr:twin-arginine translocase subunit TatC [Compostimonas suwonensis]PJJ65433.1 sec-independent protein translocase protein TatC [Compostimonas suwonensis]